MELWETDGTKDGTRIVKDIAPGTAGSDGFLWTEIDGRVLFAADDGEHGLELWSSDGTAEGTLRLTDYGDGHLGTYFYEHVIAGDEAIFLMINRTLRATLCRTDGTLEGTEILDLASAESSLNYVFDIVGVAGRKLVFLGNDEESGTEIRSYDLDTKEISLLHDFAAGTMSGNYAFFELQTMEIGGHVLFRADDAEHGMELWTTDGTADGTRLLVDIAPGPVLAVLGGRLYFIAGNEIWGTDGTPEGTEIVRTFDVLDFNAKLDCESVLDGAFFFAADDGRNGKELWLSDGTASGTRMVSDIRSGEDGTDIFGIAMSEQGLVFLADDGTYGSELWLSDGTSAGTRMIRDINVGDGSVGVLMSPKRVCRIGPELLMLLDDGEHGYEIWTTDGTTEGTEMLRELGRDTDGVFSRFTGLERQLSARFAAPGAAG